MIKLINDDCLNILSTIETNSIDLLLTDIPYNEVNRESGGLRNLDKENADVFSGDLDTLIKEFIRVCSGSIYVFCGIGQVSPIKNIFEISGLTTRLCIWEKSNPSPMNGQHVWLSGIETCIYGKKKNAVFNQHCKNTVWKYPSGQSKIHPTQKPLSLFKFIIESSSNRNQTVLDPFMGSGTTGIACKQLQRNFIGIEMKTEYFNIAKDQIDNTNEINDSLIMF